MEIVAYLTILKSLLFMDTNQPYNKKLGWCGDSRS